MIDFHCHLHDAAYDKDREEVLKRARKVGVKLFLSAGTSLEDSLKASCLSEKEPDVYFSVGIHPFEANWLFNERVDPGLKKTERYLTELDQLVSHKKALAIGEFGFDFSRDASSIEEERQTKLFLSLLKIAREKRKPIILHLRSGGNKDAYLKAFNLIKNFSYPKIAHCFTAGLKIASLFLKAGVKLSFSGILTYVRDEDQLLKVAKEASLEAGLLLETDAPYLAPVPYRGKRNEPCYIKEIYQRAAEVLSYRREEIEKLTRETFRQVFGGGFSI